LKNPKKFHPLLRQFLQFGFRRRVRLAASSNLFRLEIFSKPRGFFAELAHLAAAVVAEIVQALLHAADLVERVEIAEPQMMNFLAAFENQLAVFSRRPE
jgi:hypothetical protein